jgi:hypothetical protein
MKTTHAEHLNTQRQQSVAALVKVPLLSKFLWFRRSSAYNNEQAQ